MFPNAPPSWPVTGAPERRRELRFYAGVVAAATLAMTFALRHQQAMMAPSDHGRDLYAGWAVMEGLRPYLDFQWYYGPLGPYLVAAGYKAFGAAISSVTLASLMVLCAGSWLAYAVMVRLAPPAAAGLAALLVFYWGLPFHTFTYSGYVPCLAAGMLCLWRYLERPDDPARGARASGSPARRGGRGALAGAALAFVGLAGFKLSTGAAAVLAAAVVLLMRERRAGPALLLTGAWVAGTLAVYLPFVIGVPDHRLAACFPFLQDASSRMPPQPLTWLSDLVLRRVSGGEFLTVREALQRAWTVPVLVGASLLIGLPRVIRGLVRPDRLAARDWQLVTCWWLALLLAHEFWVFNAYWSLFQACVLPAVALAAAALADLARRWRGPEGVSLGAAGWPGWVAVAALCSSWVVWTERPDPSWFMSHPRGQVYINSHTVAEVSRTVTEFLDAHLQPGEPFGSFPSNPLYWYLARRPNATWAVDFFRQRPLTPPVEREVIGDLERRRVRCVLLSNRAESVEPEIGGFGRLFNQDLWRYLRERYQPVQMVGVGRWRPAQGWTQNHQVLILWRRGERVPAPPIPWP